MKKLIRFLTFWIPVKKWRKKCRNLLSQLTLEYLTVFIRLIGKNNVGVLSCDGMGDYIYLLGYMDEFKKTHKIKKLIFLARSNHQKFLAEKVSAFDGVILVSSSFLTLVKSQYSYNYEKFLMGNFFQPIIYQNINDKTCCALDGLKYLLNLGKDAQLNLDIYKYENFDKKKEIEKALSIYPEGKSVLISTKSVSLPTRLTDEFWISIADFLTQNGYKVLFNSQEKNFYNYETIYPSREDLKYYTDYLGFFISLRSGISDLVAVSSTAKNIVIYPTKFDQEIIKILVNAFGNFDIDIAQFIFEKWSLRKILNKGYEVFDDKLNLQGMLDYMESKEN